MPRRRHSSDGFLSTNSVASINSVPLTRQVLVEFFENCWSVSCLALFILLYARLLLRVNLFSLAMAAYLFLAVVGLTMFGLGIRHGLMPLGEQVGTSLPQSAPKVLVFVTVFCLGILCTIAEPAIGTLEAAGQDTDEDRAPLLRRILAQPFILMLGVGVGVGCAAVFGCVRLLYDLSIKRCIFATVFPTLALTLFCVSEGGTFPEISGLAWDCGAVTTGPVTVPIVLALGIGIAGTSRDSTASVDEPSLSGFGIVTFASLFPVFSVWAIGWAFGGRSVTIDPFDDAFAPLIPPGKVGIGDVQPQVDVISACVEACRAVLPLAGFLLLVLLLLRERLQNFLVTLTGLLCCLVGMFLFTLGLDGGLVPLGAGAGAHLPNAVRFYGQTWGSLVLLGFGFLAGLLATFSEPALAALGKTVEQLSRGAYSKEKLVLSVALGVGFGISLGMAKVYFDLPLFMILLVGYLLCLVLTFLADEVIVCIAWDSAGVTTGPVTVPIVLAAGLALGKESTASEGFGLLSCASIGPILAVLISSLLAPSTTRRSSDPATTELRNLAFRSQAQSVFESSTFEGPATTF
ncbi:umpB [Symbiodinium natans]|uniref:UmpB protein n=1 Tax=Symbiodinium natans TaxID=878477 RepID=A0A812TN26_9DINO|nr:umpB [Symbiodinium natans]